MNRNGAGSQSHGHDRGSSPEETRPAAASDAKPSRALPPPEWGPPGPDPQTPEEVEALGEEIVAMARQLRDWEERIATLRARQAELRKRKGG